MKIESLTSQLESQKRENGKGEKENSHTINQNANLGEQTKT